MSAVREAFIRVRRAPGWGWLAAATVGVLLGAGLALAQPTLYAATAQSFVALAPESADESDPFAGSQFILQRMDSYAALATSPEVLSAVAEQLDLPKTADELRIQITAMTPPGTVLLSVTVRDESRRQAADLANAIVREQAHAVEALEAAGGAATDSPVRVTPVEVAAVPAATASSIIFVRNMVVGLFAGVLVQGARRLLRRSPRVARSLLQTAPTRPPASPTLRPGRAEPSEPQAVPER